MNGNYCAESKNVEIPVDQIGKYTKNELFERKNSHTQYLRRTSRRWWKEEGDFHIYYTYMKIIYFLEEGDFRQLRKVRW